MRQEEQTAGVRTMFPDDAKEFMAEHTEGTYTLLDVRQPTEYEQAHLPGATLIPLPVLAASLDKLDSARPTIVYCAMGGRSRMAAQFLAHQGFHRVYSLEGGMEAWEGHAAHGPTEFHLRFVRGDETPQQIIALAYRMEKGLQGFHEAVRSRTADPELTELLGHLISAEAGHMRRLLETSLRWQLPPEELESFREGLDAALMEGGIEVEEFLARNEAFLQTISGVVDVAMMIETQALDLYLRMATQSGNRATQEVLFQIAEEEKAHLAALGSLLEEHLSKATPGAAREHEETT